MKIITTIVGDPEHHSIDWPESLLLPRESETVELPWGLVFVRNVVWYPLGSQDDNELDPFVYLVLGPARLMSSGAEEGMRRDA